MKGDRKNSLRVVVADYGTDDDHYASREAPVAILKLSPELRKMLGEQGAVDGVLVKLIRQLIDIMTLECIAACDRDLGK